MALQRRLQQCGLPADSGVSLRWVWVRFLGVPICFPNFDARRAVLVLHDVHHLLTGFQTTWTGEAEIGGFEIASGCRHLWAAWFFNLGGLAFGLGIAPRRTWRAFRLGRHVRNFYGRDPASVLPLRIAEARAELGFDRPLPPARASDRLAFVLWALAASAMVLVPLLALLAVILVLV